MGDVQGQTHHMVAVGVDQWADLEVDVKIVWAPRLEVTVLAPRETISHFQHLRLSLQKHRVGKLRWYGYL